MLSPNPISEQAQKKLQIYSAAMFLFAKGKSHPQVIRMLQEFEPDTILLNAVVDKAMHDEWDKLYLEAQRLFAAGSTYDEVLTAVARQEPDAEIAKWICTDWYNLKTLYMECLVDCATNRFEGMQWMIITACALVILFLVGASWITKSIWILAFTGTAAQWVVVCSKGICLQESTGCLPRKLNLTKLKSQSMVCQYLTGTSLLLPPPVFSSNLRRRLYYHKQLIKSNDL